VSEREIQGEREREIERMRKIVATARMCKSKEASVLVQHNVASNNP